MDKALYIAMAGAKHNTLAQTVHANNLANVATDGFRRDFVRAQSMGVYSKDSFPSRAYAMAEGSGTDFGYGRLHQTGRDLDVAIKGKGWIAVQAPDGSEAYTRQGSLQLNSVGQLFTGNGLPVLGNGGPISIPPAAKIEIGNDGSITVQPLGQGPDTLAVIDRIKLVDANYATMEKRADGLIYSRIGKLPASSSGQLVAGTLESSNVNPVESLTEILELARQYDMHIKMMRSVEENSEATAQVLQVS